MEIELRKATVNDAEMTYEWRNHPETRRYSHSAVEIIKENHIEWFRNAVVNSNRLLLIAEAERKIDSNILKFNLGVLRYDFTDNTALVSVYLNPTLHGQGYGTAILIAGSDYLRQKNLLLKY